MTGRQSSRLLSVVNVALVLVFSAVVLTLYIGSRSQKSMIEVYKLMQDNVDFLISETKTQAANTTTTVLPLSLQERFGQALGQSFEFFENMLVGNTTMDITQNVHKVGDFVNQAFEYVERKVTGTPPKDHEPLNIVLFYADDWTMKVLGKLNRHVLTPNIDEMADNGMLFRENCVTTSICWISRASLVTGVYAAVHRQVKIGSSSIFNETVQWPETLFPLLKKHGYYTGLVGKWHAPSPREFMQYTFDHMQIYYGRHWEKRNGKRRHVTDLNGEDALAFLRKRPQGQKFALKVSFFATHAWDYQYPSYQPMNESLSLYVNDTIPEPKTATDQHWRDLPWFFDDRNEGRRRWKRRFDTPTEYQSSIKNLYRMATEVDSVVGAVVDELKQQGVYDNTLLIFTTDNGNLHGEHGLSEKWYPWDESVKVPLVIQDPRMPASQRGTMNDDFTLSIDLAPTILSAAKIPVPKFMQGRDIAQLYFNPEEASKSWRKDFFYEWTQGEPVNAIGHNPYYHIPAVFALIRKDYKYFYWPQVKYEQLFNIEKDPYEEYDLLNTTKQTSQEALEIMRARYAFLKNWSQAGNPV